MKKKVLSLTLALVMALVLFPVSAFAEEEEFTIQDGVLTKYNGPGGDVMIPDGVTHIGDDAFYECSGLTSVTIPNSVTTIGQRAFCGCSGLTGVVIPDGVSNIGDAAFGKCWSLTSVVIPNSVTNIGVAAFNDCTNLTSVTISGNITRIEEKTFKYCTGLTSVTIPEGVTEIGSEAFWYCTGLTSVTIPASVTKIGGSAFIAECEKLTDVYYGGTGAQWRAIDFTDDNWAIENATIHFNSSGPVAPATYTAIPTNDTLKVDGVVKEATVYKINDANYFRIRDVAMLLSGSTRQVEVGHDGATNSVTITTGKPYTPNGSELSGLASAPGTAIVSNDTIYIDGKKAELTVYKIDGSNYFKLRDLGIALNFNVGWTQADGMYIEPDKAYDFNN